MEKIFDFRPMQYVLARDEDGEWTLFQFSHVSKKKSVYTYVMCGGYIYSPSFCIPYKGNKHLLGTTNPYVEPYEPKDGDFVKDVDDSIFVYKESSTANWADCYVGYTEGEDDMTYDAEGYTNSDTLRPASEEEKNLLLSNLHKFGKDWDAEKKKVVDLKWMPKEGDPYYTPILHHAEFIAYHCDWDDDESDKARYVKGWVFQTSEECESFCYKLNEAIQNVIR